MLSHQATNEDPNLYHAHTSTLVHKFKKVKDDLIYVHLCARGHTHTQTHTEVSNVVILNPDIYKV